VKGFVPSALSGQCYQQGVWIKMVDTMIETGDAKKFPRGAQGNPRTLWVRVTRWNTIPSRATRGQEYHRTGEMTIMHCVRSSEPT